LYDDDFVHFSTLSPTGEGSGEYVTSLRAVQEKVHSGSTNPLIIHRARLLQSTLQAVQRANFSYSRQIQVEFVGEEAEDYGGPRREFLRSEVLLLHIVFEMYLSD